MIDEVFNVMKCFPGSYINQHGELILSKSGQKLYWEELT